MPTFHLAQYNSAHLAAPLDSPQLAEFVSRLDEINAIADTAPGFVWRYVTSGSNNAVDHRTPDDRLINLSIWTGLDALWQYVYRSSHIEVMRKRRQFFLPGDASPYVLWWIPAGTVPTIELADERLSQLHRSGARPGAFDFRSPFDPDGEPIDPRLLTRL